MRATICFALVASAFGLGCSSSDGGGNATGGAAGTGSTAAGGVGGSSAGGSSGGGTGGAPSGGSSGTGAGGSSADPLEAARQACVDKINQLRATKGLSPYQRWTEKEACADQQSTSDEQSGNAHGKFGQCSEGGQNECLGSGSAGIEGCLESMWGEKDQAGCSGCDACAGAYTPNCANCDFYGDQTGDVCGHYVNMSAKYFTKVACGFSSLGGWATIDFQ
ncbi:MAG: hypothetical protein U0263_00865 [Polyangiaceae bacterium]